MRRRYDINDPLRNNQVDRLNEIATKPRAADGRRVITEAYSAQSSRVVELERILAGNETEIKRLKKFDVKFYAEYDADLKPVGPAYDLLEWQAKLQAQLIIERVHHNNAKAQLAALCAENVEDGGLMTYGPSINDLFRRAATYVDKIVKGTKSADLSVEQPTAFESIINPKAAKLIGLTIPQKVLARADKVIK